MWLIGTLIQTVRPLLQRQENKETHQLQNMDRKQRLDNVRILTCHTCKFFFSIFVSFVTIFRALDLN